MVVIFDACLFYPIAIRHFATHLAAIDDFQARWTCRIDEEWMSNVAADLGIARERLLPTLEWFALAVPDYLIEDCEGSPPDCTLPDLDDCYVLEAAVFAGAERIITANLRDFPDTVLGPYGIRAQHPDEFFCERYAVSAERMVEAARDARRGLTRKPLDPAEYIEGLRKVDLPRLAALLEAQHLHDI